MRFRVRAFEVPLRLPLRVLFRVITFEGLGVGSDLMITGGVWVLAGVMKVLSRF